VCVFRSRDKRHASQTFHRPFRRCITQPPNSIHTVNSSSVLGHMVSEVTDYEPLFRTNKHIHPKVKEVVVQLCFWFKPEEIASFLDLHPRTVQRIWKTYRETGSVISQTVATIGCPISLDWTHSMNKSST
jgi:hypothetical protein